MFLRAWSVIAAVAACVAVAPASAQSVDEYAAAAEAACLGGYVSADGHQPAYPRAEHDAACGCLLDSFAEADLNRDQYRFIAAALELDTEAGRAAEEAMSAEDAAQVREVLIAAVAACRPAE